VLNGCEDSSNLAHTQLLLSIEKAKSTTKQKNKKEFVKMKLGSLIHGIQQITTVEPESTDFHHKVFVVSLVKQRKGVNVLLREFWDLTIYPEKAELRYFCDKDGVTRSDTRRIALGPNAISRIIDEIKDWQYNIVCGIGLNLYPEGNLEKSIGFQIEKKEVVVSFLKNIATNKSGSMFCPF
jgi:hypothetical protein